MDQARQRSRAWTMTGHSTLPSGAPATVKIVPWGVVFVISYRHGITTKGLWQASCSVR